MNKFLRDSNGSSLVEFTIVFPILILVALGTVDFTYMLFDWSMANKAAFTGARTAIVSDPVTTGVIDLTYDPTLLSQPCFNPATGAASGNCPTVSTVCTPAASGGSCTNGYTWNTTETAFTNVNGTGILDRMQVVFPRLQRQNVQISYQTNSLGFVGRPNGLPMDVTVTVECMTHQFYFIAALMNWVFTAPAFYSNPPTGTRLSCPPTVAGPSIPIFATTLTSEDMCTSDHCT